MTVEEILQAIENGNLSDAKKGINEALIEKVQPAIEIKTRLDAESLIFSEGARIDEEDTEYQKFFRKALKKFGVDSPADFKSDDEKKKFFDYVDKEYKAPGEKKEEVEVEEGNQFSKALRTARAEGKKTFVVSGKTYTVEDYDEEESD